MLVRNNNECYGDEGPFEVESFESLANEMRPNFEAWVDEEMSDPDFECEDREATRALMLASLREDFIAGLVKC
jgi:hypothetical protein